MKGSGQLALLYGDYLDRQLVVQHGRGPIVNIDMGDIQIIPGVKQAGKIEADGVEKFHPAVFEILQVDGVVDVIVGVDVLAFDYQFRGMNHGFRIHAPRHFDNLRQCPYTQGMIDVAAAVIENREGRILIARRKAEITLGGYWEFPGGKMEGGESPADCAARELHEEMDVHIETGDILTETTHDYGTKVVHLIAVKAILLGGHIKLHDHDDIRWVTVSEMGDYLFAPADEAIVEALKEIHHEKIREKAHETKK